jgi:hypothetical protein
MHDAAIDHEVARADRDVARLQHQDHAALEDDEIIDRIGGVHIGFGARRNRADREVRAAGMEMGDLIGHGGVLPARIVRRHAFGAPGIGRVGRFEIGDRTVDHHAGTPFVVQPGDDAPVG